MTTSMAHAAALAELRTLSCNNHGCSVWPPTGAATNGACHCLDGMDPNDRVKVRRALSIMGALAREVLNANRTCRDQAG